MIISRGVGVNRRVGERFKSGPGSRGQAVRLDRKVVARF
jgi:hypothetical protein